MQHTPCRFAGIDPCQGEKNKQWLVYGTTLALLPYAHTVECSNNVVVGHGQNSAH
jgi:hypothetical protein